jgi:hypothetical protein
MKQLNQIIEKEDLTSVSVADLKRPISYKNTTAAENTTLNLVLWLKQMTYKDEEVAISLTDHWGFVPIEGSCEYTLMKKMGVVFRGDGGFVG